MRETMASDKKIIEEVGESSHDTPQAITITIMDPSALEATDLDSSLVTSVETQDDSHDTSTLLVVPGDGHASISVEHGAKNILQTVTETHMGTHELPVISNISNPEEETREQDSIHVTTKTSEIIDEGEGVDEEDGEEADESVGQHCLICNIDLPSEQSTEPVLVFKTQTTTTQRKMSVFLGALIGQKLTSRKAHSDIMCHRCFGLLDRVDALEVEIRDTKEEIVNKYQETVAVYGGRARRRKPATAKKTDYVFPKVEPEDEDEQVLGLEMDENFEPRVEDLMEEEIDHREDRSTQDEEWEPEFKKPRIKREAVDAESSGPTKRKRGRPRKDAAKPKESADVVTIGLAANTPAREWSEGASGNTITVFCPADGSRLRRRRPASYRPCDLCGVIPFGDVERHVAEYHPETLIRPCALCDARFRTFRQLGSHVLRIHGPSLLCPTCSSAFSDVSAFEKHLRDTHSDIPAAFTCVVCRHSLSSSIDYCTHMETHQAEAALLSADQIGKTEIIDSIQNPVGIFEEEQSQLWCSLCQKKLKSSVALKRHLQRVHGERPSFQCEICFLRFQSSGGLLDHTETHTTGAVQCPLCEKQFAKFHHLRSHCDAVHVDTASFRCQHCSYVVKSINALFTHVLVRHPDQLGLARNVRCTKCGEKFHSGRELSQHKAARHAELVECIHCGKQMSKYLIASHINEKHTRERKSECSFCGQAFFNQGKLSEHVKRHHLREHYARFVCHICNKAYITRHELLRHTAAHQNERRYKCEFCSRAYFKAGDLTYHRRIHTGERPHGCTSCEAAFSRPSELTTHLARAHGLHHRTRRYFRTASSDALESTNGPSEVIPNQSIDQTVDVQVVTEDVGDASQLITEVGEAGHVVHVVEGDMQVIYVELME